MSAIEMSESTLARLAAQARVLDRQAAAPQSREATMKIVLGGWTIAVQDARLVLPPHMALASPEGRLVAFTIDMPDPSNRLVLVALEDFVGRVVQDLSKPIPEPGEPAPPPDGERRDVTIS